MKLCSYAFHIFLQLNIFIVRDLELCQPLTLQYSGLEELRVLHYNWINYSAFLLGGYHLVLQRSNKLIAAYYCRYYS